MRGHHRSGLRSCPPVRAATAAGAVLAALLACAGCSTATPVLLQGAALPSQAGRVDTVAGHAGEISTDSGACRGSFSGTPGHPVATLEMSCRDGRRGVGTARLDDGVFVSGEVRLSDGSLVTIRQHAPAFR